MGHFISISAVLAFLILGVFAFLSTQQVMYETNRGVADDEYSELARNAAVAGAERAKQHLTRSYVGESFEGHFEGGTYDVDVTVSGTTATILSAGAFLTSEGRLARRIVRVVVEPAPEPVPREFGYGLLVDGDLRIGGSGDILSIGVTDSTAAILNTNVHTNSTLDVGSAGARVDGFGTYTGSLSGAAHAGTVFQPNYNPDGDPSVAHAAHVNFPVTDIVQMANDIGIDLNISTDMPGSWDPLATLPSRSNCELTGTLVGGSPTIPRVIYCPGNLLLDNVLVEGYAIIIATGETRIDGLVTTDVSTYPDGERSSLAVYSQSDIVMNGGDEIWAQLFTNGTLRYTGSVEIYGSLLTKGALYMGGNAKIYYRPTTASLAAPRNRNPRLLMVAYSEG